MATTTKKTAIRRAHRNKRGRLGAVVKKKSFYDKYYRDQPAWAKGVVNVVVVGGVAFAAYTIYKNAQRKKDLQEAGQSATAAEKRLAELAAAGIYPSYDEASYLSMSDSLVQAMSGCGTDEDAIFNAFRSLQNEADLMALISAFGVRYYQPCVWTSPIAYSQWLINDKAYGGDLGTWLGYDLSASDISRVNSIIGEKSINFSF